MSTFNLAALRCSGPAWLAGWVAAVFLPSALIAGFGLSQPATALGEGIQHLPAAPWKVADDVGPAAKLLMGGLLALSFATIEHLVPIQAALARYARNTVAGLLAMTCTLYLIPAAYSRGFGVADGSPLRWNDVAAVSGGGCGGRRRLHLCSYPMRSE